MYKYTTLTPAELDILSARGTEPPFSAETMPAGVVAGTYLCRGCGLALFRGNSEFVSQCGWPSFDEQMGDHVVKRLDPDGRREEIVCSRCQGHLGHVFYGENHTANNTRHCVNALAIEFVPSGLLQDSEEIIVAAGCFWGVEHLFQQLPGVLKTVVGYSGGDLDDPSYEQVCQKNTGHVEAMRVVFDPKVVTVTQILQYFFEIHDFAQSDGQGPDIGSQYLSVIFYFNEEQKNIATQLINELSTQGHDVATDLCPVTTFWPAEQYHQNYYHKNNTTPYCHRRQKLDWLAG